MSRKYNSFLKLLPLICVLFTSLFLTPVHVQAKTRLNVVTFNIRWYGLGGDFSGTGSEYRDPSIREFITTYLSNADLILFEEIVDVRRFYNNVIRDFMNCITYDHPSSKHQHVVLCYKKDFKFIKEPDDKNYALESVAFNSDRYRPALHGILVHQSGRALAHVIGLHLKAYPEKTDVRLQQTAILAKRLNELGNRLPVIVLGDMNSHSPSENGQYKNDYELMQDVFDRNHAGVMRVPNNYPTFRNDQQQHILDHVWVSYGVSVPQKPWVFKACWDQRRTVQTRASSRNYENLAYYNRYVSDHCPLAMTLLLP